MFGSRTRLLARIARPRLLNPTSVCIPKVSLSRYHSPRAAGIPRQFSQTVSRNKALEERYRQENAENEDVDGDENTYPLYSVSDGEAHNAFERAKANWPSHPNPPDGWNTNWDEYGLLPTLFSHSPYFMMLPQIEMVRIRQGIKGSPVEGVMFSDEDGSLVLKVGGGEQLYSFDMGDTQMSKFDEVGGKSPLPESKEGTSLFERIIERDDTVRQDLYRLGYLPSVPSATTEEQEASGFIGGDAQEVRNQGGEAAEILQMKEDVDQMMRDNGIEPPEDPEEWEREFMNLSQRLQKSFGDIEADIDSLRRALDDLDPDVGLRQVDELIKKYEMANPTATQRSDADVLESSKGHAVKRNKGERQ
ncbi:uncharacterized protein BT62DRAFT_918109 [Guyanagaster necrorhizus]|uniref:Uncharacterized protein n=1 Tax=Guyanagaster necrorhizus TaxID=856835 RepID=A0A9P7VXE4_9AGAR|nr:uncharacterized protein BT62DRAFT_918109 [Guyanagaster necrorhizus MCA 3950]KAG7448495.1 hypothetical protein BT62DRAFT_918109 [Guyanagaster necrorhizus MCA 3950]